MIKQYNKVRKVSTRQSDDYATSCLLDYLYFKDNYRSIAVGKSKQKALDADSKAIQQIVFQGIVGGNDIEKIRIYTILEQSKETVLKFREEQKKFCD